jgi:hypothetical protein
VASDDTEDRCWACNAPSLNEILKDLEREGLIGVRYASIDLIDITGLARRAG